MRTSAKGNTSATHSASLGVRPNRGISLRSRWAYGAMRCMDATEGVGVNAKPLNGVPLESRKACIQTQPAEIKQFVNIQTSCILQRALLGSTPKTQFSTLHLQQCPFSQLLLGACNAFKIDDQIKTPLFGMAIHWRCGIPAGKVQYPSTHKHGLVHGNCCQL